MWLVGFVTMRLQLLSFLDASYTERESRLLRRNLEWKPSEKSSNPIKETEEENKRTNENILAP